MTELRAVEWEPPADEVPDFYAEAPEEPDEEAHERRDRCANAERCVWLAWWCANDAGVAFDPDEEATEHILTDAHACGECPFFEDERGGE